MRVNEEEFKAWLSQPETEDYFKYIIDSLTQHRDWKPLKLRLILRTKTKKNKDLSIKFNIAPSKHIGFINFINLTLNQDLPINLSFEKISTKGESEESKIFGNFKLQGKVDSQLNEIGKEIQEAGRKRKKLQQKRR